MSLEYYCNQALIAALAKDEATLERVLRTMNDYERHELLQAMKLAAVWLRFVMPENPLASSSSSAASAATGTS